MSIADGRVRINNDFVLSPWCWEGQDCCLVGIWIFFYLFLLCVPPEYLCYACSYGKILVESVNQIYIVNVYCTIYIQNIKIRFYHNNQTFLHPHILYFQRCVLSSRIKVSFRTFCCYIVATSNNMKYCNCLITNYIH